MGKRALPAVIGFFGVCVGLSAPQTRGAEELQPDSIMLDHSPRLPAISLEDTQRYFFSTSFGLIQPTADFLPTFTPVQPRSAALSKNVADRGIVPDTTVDFRPANRLYVGGEIGFLYGRSSGKYGFEYERGYVIGEIGNDKFHLTVGTVYERSNWRGPQRGSFGLQR